MKPAKNVTRPEHPRAGGDDDEAALLAKITGGTPPRWRGRPGGFPSRCAPGGNTPALAGTTTSPRCALRGSGEHPRAGGDDMLSLTTSRPSFGTPPRWRGRLGWRCERCGKWRNTPALAGTTSACGPRRPSRSEHPRAGGDDIPRRGRQAVPLGTPPRWRGRPRAIVAASAGVRNTPALAGTTPAWRLAVVGWREHPRAGGDDPAGIGSGRGRQGTPPRWRGRPATVRAYDSATGNTPALAGTTPRRGERCDLEQEHPRAGGDDMLVTNC